MTTSVLTPFQASSTVDLGAGGKLFRKQILPKKTITYRGKKITFDDGYLADLANAFRDKAFDVTSFILSGPNGEHNIDPTKHRGSVKGMLVTPDGLDAIIELSDDAAAMVKDNPELPVSCRIKEGIERADGTVFKRAVHHVLATLDPVITGMRPWQAIDLSNDDLVLDLSGVDYDKENPMAPRRTTLVLSDNITDEQRAGLEALGLQVTEETPDTPPNTAGLTDEEIEAALAELDVVSGPDDDPDDDDDDDDGPDLSNLPEDVRRVIDLANARAAGADERVTAMLTRTATERWTAERGRLASAGVPPFLLDLAAPLMAQPDEVMLDFSNAAGSDPEVNVTDVMRQMLDGMASVIELSQERGHSIDLGGGKGTEEEQVSSFLEQWDAAFPV